MPTLDYIRRSIKKRIVFPEIAFETQFKNLQTKKNVYLNMQVMLFDDHFNVHLN